MTFCLVFFTRASFLLCALSISKISSHFCRKDIKTCFKLSLIVATLFNKIELVVVIIRVGLGYSNSFWVEFSSEKITNLVDGAAG